MAGELLLDTRALVSLLDRSQPLHSACKDLVQKYADLPMDFADASLVVLAEDLGTNFVFTTDFRDFEVYRIKGRRRFQIFPE